MSNGLNFHDEMVSKMSNRSDLGKTYTQSYNDWLDKHDAEIRADAIRKFAEWLQSNGYYVYVMSTPDGLFTDEVTVDEIISAYEKEQK